MANTKGIGSAVTPTPLTETKPKETKGSGAKDPNAMGEQEFLMLLVNQLQQQDPLNPMDNQEFAVQLAQFSQVEQLIEINDKLDSNSGGASSVGSMASFLGNEVVLTGDAMKVQGGKGNNLLLEVPAGTQSLRVDFMDADGKVVGSKNIAQPDAGKQVLAMDELGVPNGDYSVRVVSVDSQGRFAELKPKVTGTVEGFIVSPEPKLIVNGNEVNMEDVIEVYTGKA